jgi:hypothetical protein
MARAGAEIKAAISSKAVRSGGLCPLLGRPAVADGEAVWLSRTCGRIALATASIKDHAKGEGLKRIRGYESEQTPMFDDPKE